MRCLALLFCALLAVAAAAAPNGTARNKTAHIQKAHSSAADSADDNDNMTAPPAERGDDAGADALVTGVTAFDADSLISDKLARSVNETNITLCATGLHRRCVHLLRRCRLTPWLTAACPCRSVYLAHFTRMCSASCDSDNTTANQPLVAGRRMLELCDDCWCRQNRPCTVSPPYEVRRAQPPCRSAC